LNYHEVIVALARSRKMAKKIDIKMKLNKLRRVANIKKREYLC
jgi:hypothetical protein